MAGKKKNDGSSFAVVRAVDSLPRAPSDTSSIQAPHGPPSFNGTPYVPDGSSNPWEASAGRQSGGESYNEGEVAPVPVMVPIDGDDSTTGNSAWAQVSGAYSGNADDTAHSFVSADELARRAAALDKREKDLDRRERELKKLSRGVTQAAAVVAGSSAVPPARNEETKKANFPGFKPIVYHDIQADILDKYKLQVRVAFVAWSLLASTSTYNWLVITVMWIGKEKSGADFFFALMAMIFGVFGSFFGWYRSLYFAGKYDSFGTFVRFSMLVWIQIFWAAFMFTGPPIIGKFSAGLVTMLDQWIGGSGKEVAFGIMSLINVVAWALGGLMLVWVYFSAQYKFRNQDEQYNSAALRATDNFVHRIFEGKKKQGSAGPSTEQV